MIERIKTWIVVFLIIFVLYQLFDLWYELPTDMNIINDIINRNVQENDEDYYLKPNKVIISFGNGQFTIVKATRVESTMIYSYIRDIYNEIFNTRDDIILAEESIEELYNEKSIILEYGSDYEDEFKEIFNIKSEKVIKKIEGIKRVIIHPEVSVDDDLKVYIQSKNDNIYVFNIATESAELYGLIDEINIFNQMDIYVLSTNEASKDFFEHMTLIPVIINDTSFMSRKTIVENPFINEETIEEYANIFFENPKAKWKMQKDESIIIYGDGEKSVRIYKDGYIEYASNVQKILETFTLRDSLKIAEDFLSKEIYSSGEIYLANISEIDNNEYKLYYDYRIDGFDEMISKNIKDKYNITYPLEVIVSNGKVTSYKRIVQNVSFQQSLEEYDIIPYNEVLDVFANQLVDNKIKIMQISYYKETSNSNPRLVWYVETQNGEVMIYEVLRRIV